MTQQLLKLTQTFDNAANNTHENDNNGTTMVQTCNSNATTMTQQLHTHDTTLEHT